LTIYGNDQLVTKLYYHYTMVVLAAQAKSGKDSTNLPRIYRGSKNLG